MDEVESARWPRLAAEQGHAVEQTNQGSMFARGLGVLKDQALGRIWLDNAGANGDEDARNGRDRAEALVTTTRIEQTAATASECRGAIHSECGL